MFSMVITFCVCTELYSTVRQMRVFIKINADIKLTVYRLLPIYFLCNEVKKASVLHLGLS
jgi:hypothetical protein